MSKEHEIQTLLTSLQVGDSFLIPTDEDMKAFVERVFEGWILDTSVDRIVYRDLEQTIVAVSKIWNTDLKQVIHLQYSELGEIEDLGEF